MTDNAECPPVADQQPIGDQDRRQGILREIMTMPETEFVQSDRTVKPEEGHEVVGIMTAVERAAYTIADRESDKLIARTKELAPLIDQLDEIEHDKLIEEELLPLIAHFHCASEIMWVLICQRIGFKAVRYCRICQGWQIVRVPPQADEDDEDNRFKFGHHGQDRFGITVMGNIPEEVRRGVERYLQTHLRRKSGGGITIVDEEEDDFAAAATTSKKGTMVN